MRGRDQGSPGSALERAQFVHEGKAVDVAEVPKATDQPQTLRGSSTVGRLVSRRASPKAHLFVTVCHWAMVILLALSLLSGMRIGWGYEESLLGGQKSVWGSLLGSIAPKGTLFGISLIDLHIYLAFLMLLATGVYIGYMIRSGAIRRITVTGKTFQKLSAGLRAGHFLQNKGALWSANLLVYWISFFFVAMLTVSGIALYRVDLGFSGVLGGYDAVRLLHGLIAYLLIPYTLIHALLQWFFGRFWTIFKAQLYRPHARAGTFAVILCSPVVAGFYLLNSIPTTLTVPRLPVGLQAPVLDGDARDPIWSAAQPVVVRTVKGANTIDHTDVSVKAVHDGQYVYFQFQWADADVSSKRYPLLKTEDGWKMLQTAFERADESVFYEDKLSLYVTKLSAGSCASTCHLGVGPASERNEKHGLHYTTGEVGDVWHWKSVRTDPMGELTGEPGFLDDQHFGPPKPLPENPKERYTGGYYPDPDEGGGYAYNIRQGRSE
jgi:cytochrome b subunit of formate dehydrogenase